MTDQSFAGKGHIKSLLAIVLIMVIIVTAFVPTAFAASDDRYEVTIVDGTKTTISTTTETEPIEILKSAGITLSSKDKLDITGFKSSGGGKIVVNRLNKINVDFDGNIRVYDVYSNTVGEALSEIGAVLPKDSILNYDNGAEIVDGMVITIKSPGSVILKVDSTCTKYAMIDGTVADLLKLAGVELDGNDYTKPSLNTKLEKDMKVSVYKVEVKQEVETETINYSTKEIKDATLVKGKKVTLKKGVDGKADVTYNVVYVNGKPKEKKFISKNVVTPAVDKEVKVGTKKVKTSSSVKPNGVEKKNGYEIGQKIKGRYSHYCACSTCNGNSRGITSSGKRIRNGMEDPHYVACNWLPLGTVIKVDGTNYTVVDRGGRGLSTKGRIDIFTPAGHSECYRLGVGNCEIEIVRLGW